MAATDYIMGTLFAAVVAFLIFLSFSRGLSPVIVGTGILVSLVLWYLVNGSDVGSPSTSTSSVDNRAPSTSSQGSGPNLDGPDLGNGNGGSNNSGGNNSGGSNSGGGNSGGAGNGPMVQLKVPRGTKPPVNAGNIDLEVKCQASGSGLEALTLEIPDFGEQIGENLNGVPNTVEDISLARIIGNVELGAGETEIRAILFDQNRNEARDAEVLKISNKNSGGQSNNMPDFDELEKDLAALDENDLPKAINALKNHHEHLKAEEELSDRLFNDAKDFLEHIHAVRQDLIDLENNNLTQKQSRQELQDLHDHLEDALRDLRDFEELVESEKAKVNEDSQLLAKLENAEDAIEPKMNYLQNHQRDLKQAIGT
ncbi:MAG: hypothetical protein BRC29_01135 [Nanohaloarchaea archaeon SW_7_43_1]|nr:MAG: hypothetical protein BRC29_01135 [Nanohaloarchaea archaeon SW_7_43_1]